MQGPTYACDSRRHSKAITLLRPGCGDGEDAHGYSKSEPATRRVSDQNSKRRETSLEEAVVAVAKPVAGSEAQRNRKPT
jgi:hypothetical protein